MERIAKFAQINPADCENVFCAMTRKYTAADVFVFGQDLYDITEVGGARMKMWGDTNWIPLCEARKKQRDECLRALRESDNLEHLEHVVDEDGEV